MQARAKLEELTGKPKSETAEKAQLELDIVQHKSDKASAEADRSKAEAVRSKEQAEFEADSEEAKPNIAAMGNAIPALEKGMGGASLMQLPGGVGDKALWRPPHRREERQGTGKAGKSS